MNLQGFRAAFLILLFAPGSAKGLQQKPMPQGATPVTASFSLVTDRQVLVSLDGHWRFHPGDDPRWSEPGLDDSAWPLLRSDQPWSTQGYDGMSGFAWYRFTVHTPAQAIPLAIL